MQALCYLETCTKGFSHATRLFHDQSISGVAIIKIFYYAHILYIGCLCREATYRLGISLLRSCHSCNKYRCDLIGQKEVFIFHINS